ncbi:MAG: ABC transporter ATP-binding protein [Acidobacteria bacterium]|nr:ABC transporter ATP-binding protein [Acidobacteriota bacterium]
MSVSGFFQQIFNPKQVNEWQTQGLPLVLIEDLTKSFHNGAITTPVLNGVDLTINAGEFVAVHGPSGCGKSTLLAIMGLLDSQTAGVYCFKGQPVQNLKPAERAKARNQDIGFVFQNFNLIGDMTVLENVEQPLSYMNVAPRERRARALAALERTGLADRAKQRPSQLSGGHQQLASLARAIVCNPTMLLADEPTGNLDSASGERVMQLMRELHSGGTTICLVTHDDRFLHLADRRVAMLDGKMVQA